MTCKDCVHCEVCKNLIIDGKIPYESGKYPAEKFCLNFKDKSKVIELPCKVGDTVYIPYGHCNGKGCPYNGAWSENWRCNYKGEKHCKPFVDEIPFDLTMIKQIGKTMFLTKEKALKKLK